ncbi:MAG: FUSC family protein [Pseudonocardia sp.]|nr:FUSC family protein [Pseudonocardia sp.]
MRHGLLGELTRWEAHAGAHRPAIRCGVTVGVPLAVLVVLGRFELAGFAAFGAFTAIYGRDLGFPRRARLHAVVAVLLTASVAVGLLAAHLPGAPWSVLAVLVALTAVTGLIGELLAWKPAGPLFFLFAAGASSAMAPLGTQGMLTAVAVTAGVAAFGVVVGSAGALLRRRDPVVRRERVPGRIRAVLAPGGAARATVVDATTAATIAGVIGAGAGVHHVYWTVIAAVVPFAVVPDPTKRLARGLLRAGGTVAGIAVAAAVLALGLPAWALVLAIVVAQVGAELFVMRNYGVALLFITPLAMLLGTAGLTTFDTAALLADRVLTTAIGISAGIVVLAVRHSGALVAGSAPEPTRLLQESHIHEAS